MSFDLTHFAEEILMLKGVCVVKGDSVSGTVIFSQDEDSSPVEITAMIQGLSPGKHGISINVFGDVTNGCTSTGPHFNPLNKEHGAPGDVARHAGDLGNVEADQAGMAKFKLSDSVITLSGPNSIIGRAVVVYAGTDDLGRGRHENSASTGDTGARLACGVIGISS
jgi:Cu-Zn family superoxide dismutase